MRHEQAEEKARLKAAATRVGQFANPMDRPKLERKDTRKQASATKRQSYADRQLQSFRQTTARLKAAERVAEVNPTRRSQRDLAKAQAEAQKAAKRFQAAVTNAGSDMRVDREGHIRLHHHAPEPTRRLKALRKREAKRKAKEEAKKKDEG
ncbi:MAG: hypothetical protein LBO20_07030 [Bifidobacteriaceae bacterium]|jgi:hypothetical protein|nr:hypothetical protein [Bifidobacteriaceae bacterium]